MAEQVLALADQQRFEEAGVLRDELVALRSQLERHRRVSSLREAGRVVLAVEGEGEVVLDGGVWLGGAGAVAPRGEAEDQLDRERAIVAQWLAAHPESVRIVEVESSAGLGMPARRIPELAELCARDPATATDSAA